MYPAPRRSGSGGGAASGGPSRESDHVAQQVQAGVTGPLRVELEAQEPAFRNGGQEARPVVSRGKHHIGVCTNTMCGLLGGDAIWNAISSDLGAGHDETTEDGMFTLEKIECQAACTHAPVVTIDWEFIDDATVEMVRDFVGRLKRGEEVQPTRGPKIRSLAATERTIAGFDDGLADAPAMDKRMLAGLTAAKAAGTLLPESQV